MEAGEEMKGFDISPDNSRLSCLLLEEKVASTVTLRTKVVADSDLFSQDIKFKGWLAEAQAKVPLVSSL